MAYDETLAGRIRDAIASHVGTTEKKMFGGVVFLLNGNILVGVWKDSLIARVGPVAGEKALKKPHVRVMDVTGKPMKGWVLIEPIGIEDDVQLASWIKLSMKFVETLPAKA